MSERNTSSRRSFLKKSAAATVVGTVGATGLASAAYDTKIVVEETSGDEPVDYTIELNGSTMEGGSNLESRDSYDSNSCTGQVQGGKDTYWMGQYTELDRIEASGGVYDGTISGAGNLVVNLYYDLEDTQTGTCYVNGLEPGGGTEGMLYAFEPVSGGSVSGNGNEWNDGDGGGDRASGYVKDGGTDSFDMTGQFKHIELNPAGGALEIDRYI